jgi:hypothetical protein
VYAAYIATQLDREEERKRSLESRGVTVVSTSGTLATVLLGLIAIATRSDSTFTLPHDARVPLAIALGAFSVAALLAIYTNAPRRGYEAASLKGLRTLVDERWDATESQALSEVAKNQLKVLAAEKTIHKWKARALVAAIATEAVAVVALLAAMITLLY